MSKNPPTPGDSVIDSRDIIARLEELQEELDELESPEAVQEWHDDNDDEYLPLVKLAEECEGYGDWEHGETLIHRSIFQEYCIGMIQDIGDMPKDIPSYIEIDWDKTVANLEADYMSVDFDGHEYLMRA